MAERTPDQERRYRVHYEEFLGRGLTEAESKRLAEAVLARDLPGASLEPLTLSPDAYRE